MFCVNCGTEQPQDANYCFKCRHPQGKQVDVLGSPIE